MASLHDPLGGPCQSDVDKDGKPGLAATRVLALTCKLRHMCMQDREAKPPPLCDAVYVCAVAVPFTGVGDLCDNCRTTANSNQVCGVLFIVFQSPSLAMRVNLPVAV